MAICHRYLLDTVGHVKAREIVEGLDDKEAVEKARHYLGDHGAIPAGDATLLRQPRFS